jgi:hypothetical protein
VDCRHSMLYRFRLRKDAPCHSEKPAGYCFGWDCSLAPDYAASGFIMGVGASLRWMTDAGLKTTLERLLAEMATCSNDNGWFLPWSESEMAANWYSTSGMNVITEALIEADGVVSHDVMRMLRHAHDAYLTYLLRATLHNHVSHNDVMSSEPSESFNLSVQLALFASVSKYSCCPGQVRQPHALARQSPCERRSGSSGPSPRQVREGIFLCHLYIKMHLFAKTGSGQT